MKTASDYLLAHKLPAIILLSIVVRLAALLMFPSVFAYEQTGVVHGSDAYDIYAQNLLETGVYGREPGVADAQIPPLYSYALAGIYGVFGRGHWQLGLFQIILDAVSITMLYHIGRRLMSAGEWVGALAALFYAFYPYLVFQNLTVIDTPLFMTLLYVFVYLMVLLRARAGFDRATIWLALASGLVLGLAMLTRPILPPLALLIAVWFFIQLGFKQTILRLAPVAIVGALVITPWIVRNFGVFDAFVPMTTTSGANFWQGNSEFTIPYFQAGYDVQWTSPQTSDNLDPYSREADAERFRLGFAFLRDNPGQIPELLWTKFRVYWSIDITPRLNPTGGQIPRPEYQGNPLVSADEAGNLELIGLPDDDPVNLYSQTTFARWGRAAHRYYFGALFILAIAGIALTARERKNVSLLWSVQISMMLVYLVFHPSTRYRAPTDPLLFLFSAYTLVALWLWYMGYKQNSGAQAQLPNQKTVGES